MRHRAAVAVCRRFAEEAGLDLEALTRVLGARVVPVAAVARATPVVPVAAVARPTSADPAVPVAAVPATSADPVALAVPVTAVLAVPVVPVTSAGRVVPATSADPVAPAARATSADPVAPTTSDRGLPTPSAASVVPRGAMARRRGAGEHRRGPGGVGPSPRRAECGTKGRSITGATTSNRYGIRAKTVGASISSESGSRCNQPAG
jgi:hypothetical protein